MTLEAELRNSVHVSSVWSTVRESVIERVAWSLTMFPPVSAPSGIVWRVVIVIGLFGYFSQTSVSIRSKETVQDSKCEGIVLIVTSLVRPMSAKKGPGFTM